MYVGHFAIGLAIKAYKPAVPIFPIVFGVAFLDILDGLFIIAGLDRVKPDLHALPYLYFDLSFIDWDHSLLMAALWSLAWGALFLKQPQVAKVAAVAVFSHFLADWPVHNADLALFPYSEQHLGLGLWGKLGVESWLLEGAFSAVLAFYFWHSSRKRGINAFWPCVLLVVLFIQLSPWFSPMKEVARLDEPAAHMLHGMLVTLGFLVPGFLFWWLIRHSELPAGKACCSLA